MDLRERRSRGRLQGEVSLTLGLEGREESLWGWYDTMLDPDQARGAMITLRLPLWDWGRNRYSVLSKQTEIDQNYRTQEENIVTIRREVQSSVARVLEGEDRLELMQQSVQAATRSFQLSLEQFELGAVTVQDMLLIQNQLADAESDNLEAYIDYRQAKIDMEAVTKASGFGRGGGGGRGFF
jgi:outer membrane protein TolC